MTQKCYPRVCNIIYLSWRIWIVNYKGLSDVASILARRVALEVSDSDDGPSDSEYDSDDWGKSGLIHCIFFNEMFRMFWRNFSLLY